MRKAAEYYRGKLALRGGYVYYYSPDLKLRHGEGVASPTQIWVQPPGTPTVGLAFLAAYRATGDKLYLDAARDAGEALIYGQLKSGGWQNNVDFDPQGKGVNLYRNGKGRRGEQLHARRRHLAVGHPLHGPPRRSAGIQRRGGPRIGRRSRSTPCSRPNSPTAPFRKSGPAPFPASP